MSVIFDVKDEKLRELIVSRTENAISTEMYDETVILDISSGIYSGLDPVGTTIWTTLERPISFDAIVKVILSTYDVAEEECIRDLVEFLKRLAEINLIVVHDAQNM